MAFGEHKSIEAMDEEDERLERQLSIAQRKARIAEQERLKKELRRRGDDPEMFKDPRSGQFDFASMKFRLGGRFSK